MRCLWGLVIVCLLSASAFGSASSGSMSLEQLKMDKRFGIGLKAAGALSIFGIEVDINVTENFSLTGGLGTGLDYSTLAFAGKYYLLGKSVSPYVGIGFARWWSDSVSSRDLTPAIVKNDFLADDFRPENGLNLFLLYPMLGVQYLHAMGLEFTAEVMYLFKVLNLANGAYAGMGVHWYF